MGDTHKDTTPLGISDVIAGAVIFMCLALLSAHVAGPEGYGFLRNLLTEERSTELIISGLLFIFVWFVLGNLVIKPYLNALYQREEQTSGLKIENNSLKNEVQNLKREISAEIKNARLEGIKKRDQKMGEAKKMADEALEAGKQTADAEWNKQSSELERMQETLFTSVDSEVEALANVLYSKVAETDTSSKVIH